MYCFFWWGVRGVGRVGPSWYAVRGSDPAIRGNEHFMFKLSWYGAEGADPAIRGNGHFMFKLSWYGAEGTAIRGN